ncbi:hypothetical protein [Salinisphaera hydrothermalis]|uniref:hypothetical protein n=1 Tax=Salinisphaera hydrothermalis TaxID=563188 RepID=UPI00333FFC61
MKTDDRGTDRLFKNQSNQNVEKSQLEYMASILMTVGGHSMIAGGEMLDCYISV